MIIVHHAIAASLFLIYMDTLMKQIFDIVRKEKRKQAWVPIAREVWTKTYSLNYYDHNYSVSHIHFWWSIFIS